MKRYFSLALFSILTFSAFSQCGEEIDEISTIEDDYRSQTMRFVRYMSSDIDNFDPVSFPANQPTAVSTSFWKSVWAGARDQAGNLI